MQLTAHTPDTTPWWKPNRVRPLPATAAGPAAGGDHDLQYAGRVRHDLHGDVAQGSLDQGHGRLLDTSPDRTRAPRPRYSGAESPTNSSSTPT